MFIVSAYMLNKRGKPIKLTDRLHILYSMIEKEGKGIRQSNLDVIISKTDYYQSDVEALVKNGLIEKSEVEFRHFFYQPVGTHMTARNKLT